MVFQFHKQPKNPGYLYYLSCKTDKTHDVVVFILFSTLSIDCYGLVVMRFHFIFFILKSVLAFTIFVSSSSLFCSLSLFYLSLLDGIEPYSSDNHFYDSGLQCQP